MKRLLWWAALTGMALALPSLVLAQAEKPAAAGNAFSLKAWEWANFLVLAGGLGYIIQKNVGPTLEARGREIRKAMLEAEDARKEAEQRVAAAELRLSRLPAEIAALHSEARREEQAESARSAARMAAETAKIHVHAEQEIAAAGKAAGMELQRHTAELALTLAKQKIRARMTPEAEDQMVQAFLEKLHGPSSSAYAN